MATSAVSTAAEATTAAATWAATSTSSATAAAAAGATTAVSASIWATICASFRAALPCGSSGYRGIAVEVGFVVGEIGAAFDGERRSVGRFTAAALSSTVLRWKFAAAHFCALLFEDGFARQTDAVAFDGKHFYQHLIAFLEFIAHVLNAMLRHFTDVQQAVSSRDNFDESPEIRQPSHGTEISLPHLGCSRQIANNLQRVNSRSIAETFSRCSVIPSLIFSRMCNRPRCA